MVGLIVGGGGFLLAVLWFDLMFDTQLRGNDGDIAPERVLSSIAGYYARVTTGAEPMNKAIPLAMVVVLAGIGGQAVTGERGLQWVLPSLALALPPMLLAGRQTVPNAVRLGKRGDDKHTQTAIARSIYRDHRYCAASVAGLLIVQVLAAIATG